MNVKFQLGTARKTFIDGVKLTTQQKDVAFNSLNQKSVLAQLSFP